MAIDPSIGAALVELNVAFKAATPVESAPPLVYAKLRDKAQDLVVLVDAAAVSIGSPLDAPEIPTAILEAPAFLIGLDVANVDESSLVDLRALAGRIRTNINQSVT